MSTSLRVLIVDIDRTARAALAGHLSGRHQVEQTETAECALELCRSFRPDVVITEITLPGMSGLALVEKIASERVVLVRTADPSAEKAVQALKRGAKDYLVGPLDLPAIDAAIAREVARHQMALDLKRVRERAAGADSEVWGESQELRDVLQTATDVASSRATVLITGESGTGKEVLARLVHRRSTRAGHAFVAVNCGAIPESLLESELFGHEKGAFTGAVAAKAGRFERAHGGTIFLDEIGELSPAMQVKLLRVIQERQIERVGGTQPIAVDVRIIAATNRDLGAEMKTGRFREDLYYRLNVFEISMPALRARKSDIPELWSRFVARFSGREGVAVAETTVDAYEALVAHDWPGNVRELENLAERAVILSRGTEIGLHHLPASFRPRASEEETPFVPGTSMDAIEKAAILKTLAAVGGSTQKAAKMLGISARKIQYRLREWRDEATLAS